ncbi:MAG: aminodeoxychorismate lyase [Gammaproteobacteria bacterium]
MMGKWLVNGRESQSIGVDDRGLAYGDGLFETIAVRGGHCRFFPEHLQRLLDGCERLRIPPPDQAVLQSEAAGLAEDCDHGALKIIVTRGAGPRAYAAPSKPRPLRVLGLEHTEPASAEDVQLGVRVRYCEMPISRNPALAGLKTLNRLEQVLARSEWANPDIREGLMLDDRRSVTCGTMTNLFMVSDNVLKTPLLTEAGVTGIMRNKIIQQALSSGIETRELIISTDDVANASEVFLSNALIGIWPIREIDGTDYARGPVTLKIMQALRAIGVQECKV